MARKRGPGRWYGKAAIRAFLAADRLDPETVRRIERWLQAPSAAENLEAPPIRDADAAAPAGEQEERSKGGRGRAVTERDAS